jgi:hypothetical protein
MKDRIMMPAENIFYEKNDYLYLLQIIMSEIFIDSKI